MARKPNSRAVADIKAALRRLPEAEKLKIERWLRQQRPRKSRWREVDERLLPIIAVLAAIYREKYGLKPTAFFKWLVAIEPSTPGTQRMFGSSRDAAWRRLYAQYKAKYQGREFERPQFKKLKAAVDSGAARLAPPPSGLLLIKK